MDWLKGFTVILLGHYVPAPLAAWYLRNLGAKVIKIEPPSGDFLRGIEPFAGEGETARSVYFEALNCGFESISLNWKHPEGKKVLAELLKKGDVILDGNRAGYVEELLGNKMATLAPDGIYIPVSGLGLQGPMSHQAAHDNNALALAGLLSYTTPAEDGGPAPFGAPVADMAAASTAALCAVAGLLSRLNPHAMAAPPQTIDASILHSAFFFNLLQLPGYSITGQSPQSGKEWVNGGLPNYSPYPTADGRFVFFGPIEPNLFANFFLAIGRKDILGMLALSPQKVQSVLKEVFLEKTATEWAEFGKNHDVCLTVVHTLEEAVQHPQIQSLDLFREVSVTAGTSALLPNFPAGFAGRANPSRNLGPAPRIGQHTTQICRELLQYPENKTSALLAEGALYASSPEN